MIRKGEDKRTKLNQKMKQRTMPASSPTRTLSTAPASSIPLALVTAIMAALPISLAAPFITTFAKEPRRRENPRNEKAKQKRER